MKKIFICISLVLIVLMLTTISVNAEEVIPTIPEELPSDLALWFEENIIPAIVAVITGLSIFIVSIVKIYKAVKGILNLVYTEKQSTNETQNNATLKIAELERQLANALIEIKTSNSLMNNVILELQKQKIENTELREFITKYIGGVREEQLKIEEVLKLTTSNNPDYVRLGVAETVNKLLSVKKEV